MNLQQANIVLKKINRLYESMILDSKIDIHEQKLMLSYIQQLHTSFSDDDAPIIKTPVQKIETKVVPPVVKVSTPKVVQPKVIKEEIPVSPPPVVVAPKVEEPVVVKPPVVVAPPTPKPKPAPTPVAAKTAIPEEVESLFMMETNPKELSEKLAAQPIRDLTKAMGLNEKFLTRDELFGKDNDAFNSALTKLNSFSSFEHATGFLAELATKYGWTKRNKKKKAQIFIKLVRRRYN